MRGLPERLRELRRSKGMTQQQAAKAVGMGRSTWLSYESGRRNPPYHVVSDIAEYFGVTTDYLGGMTEENAGCDGNVYLHPIGDELVDILAEWSALEQLVISGKITTKEEERRKSLICEIIKRLVDLL